MNKTERTLRHKNAYNLLVDLLDAWQWEVDNDKDINGAEAVDYLVSMVQRAKEIVKP